jgi:Tol biopolymer transport system component
MPTERPRESRGREGHGVSRLVRRWVILVLLWPAWLQASQLSVRAAGEEPARSEGRPILYLDVDGEAPVISAVLSDGTVRKGLVRTTGTVCLVCSGTSPPVWSPDGRHFAYITYDVKMKDWVLYQEELEGTAREISRTVGGGRDLAWSPDGKKIAVLGGSTIHVFSVDSGNKRTYSLEQIPSQPRVSGPMAHVDKFRWSPDGRRLLISWGAALVLDTENGGITEIASHPVLSEWAPDGKGVYYLEILVHNEKGLMLGDWGGLYYRSLGQAEAVEVADRFALTTELGVGKGELVSATMWPGFLSVSPDGSLLAFLVRRTKEKSTDLFLYRIGKEAQIDIRRPERKIRIDDLLLDLAWSPTGRRVAAVGVEKAALTIKMLDLQSEEWTTLATITDETVGSIYAMTGRSNISWME